MEEKHAWALGAAHNRVYWSRGHTSLGDIHALPTRSKFTLFQGFLNFLSQAPKFRFIGGGGGGMCTLFEICEKRPFQKCTGWGGGGMECTMISCCSTYPRAPDGLERSQDRFAGVLRRAQALGGVCVGGGGGLDHGPGGIGILPKGQGRGGWGRRVHVMCVGVASRRAIAAGKHRATPPREGGQGMRFVAVSPFGGRPARESQNELYQLYQPTVWQRSDLRNLPENPCVRRVSPYAF